MPLDCIGYSCFSLSLGWCYTLPLIHCHHACLYCCVAILNYFLFTLYPFQAVPTIFGWPHKLYYHEHLCYTGFHFDLLKFFLSVECKHNSLSDLHGCLQECLRPPKGPAGWKQHCHRYGCHRHAPQHPAHQEWLVVWSFEQQQKRAARHRESLTCGFSLLMKGCFIEFPTSFKT